MVAYETVVRSKLPQLSRNDVALYLTDLEQRLLIAVPGEGMPERGPLAIADTLGGRASRNETTVLGAAVCLGQVEVLGMVERG